MKFVICRIVAISHGFSIYMRKVPCVCAVCASTIPELNIAQSVTVAKKNSHSLLNSIDIHRGPKLKQSRVSECICTNLTNKERCVEHLSFRVLLYSIQLVFFSYFVCFALISIQVSLGFVVFSICVHYMFEDYLAWRIWVELLAFFSTSYSHSFCSHVFNGSREQCAKDGLRNMFLVFL